ncbi:probable N-acetyltransferase HLS1 [Telopea speciosissima]|uniref:probable N-acetyltransferase HLS1 n=1 Tax=Telopea speciosissima TaxID=54955 RepID=UPI001CC78880|nr:probable N-acetyltransferase HLS1 [Telopea speciosissima]
MTKQSIKIAEQFLKMEELRVREYDKERDRQAVEEMEKRCELGLQAGKPSLCTDLMGDPTCRIRHSPSSLMLVAEYGEEKEIVGVIRGCIKTVTRGKKKPMSSSSNSFPIYAMVAYILGLRVLPTHRRLGIGTRLVEKLEEWGKEEGAEYAYMATECTNEASINLFTLKCAYVKFRTPTILVQPVHAHYKHIGSGITIVQLAPQLTESIYRRVFANSEFFSKDIDVILYNKLNLGTFMALPKGTLHKWDPRSGHLPPCFAILSVWNSKEVFKFQVKGVSVLKYALCIGSRILDAWMPWLRIPSIPDVFRPFGVYNLYGLHMEGGKGASRLMKSLCAFAHNMASDDAGCGALVAEVGSMDPVRQAVPHWRRFSWAEDLWCMKKLSTTVEDDDETCGVPNWITSRPSSPVIFFDPRDF